MPTCRLVVVAAIAAGLFRLDPASAQVSQGGCGATVTVARGDTLSRIAERCDVSELTVLRNNPDLRGSDDLRVGMELKLSGNAAGSPLDRAADRLRSLTTEAGEALEGFARSLGSSAEDLLNSNPDLHQRLLRLGDRLNVPGVDADKARMSIEPRSGAPGTPVTISAIGLPANTELAIGGGPPRSAYEVLARARSSGDGTLQATVQLPAWAGEMRRFVFVVASENGNLTLRSSPFTVTGAP